MPRLHAPSFRPLLSQAAGRVTCPAEAAASEALRPLQRVFRRVTGPGWSPFPGSDVGRGESQLDVGGVAYR